MLLAGGHFIIYRRQSAALISRKNLTELGGSKIRGCRVKYISDRRGDPLHRYDGNQGNQHQQQGVLCQVLARLIRPQMKDKGFHAHPPLGGR